jgi:hypothetical protein
VEKADLGFVFRSYCLPQREAALSRDSRSEQRAPSAARWTTRFRSKLLRSGAGDGYRRLEAHAEM